MKELKDFVKKKFSFESRTYIGLKINERGNLVAKQLELPIPKSFSSADIIGMVLNE